MRLDAQRLPARLHKRSSSRKYKRGYFTLPHAIWGDVVAVVTAVTAGTPGSFTPAGAKPANLSALQALGALGQSTAWTAGQYVVLLDGTEAYWSGVATGWLVGRKP